MSTRESELAEEVNETAPRQPGLARQARLALLGILLVSTVATVAAMLRTSTTFDEIVMIAGGARGFETGKFDLAPEHPPFTQYLYGLPVFIAGASYPDETGAVSSPSYRYRYAQEFFWRAGNDPELLAFLGRLMGVACAAALVIAVFYFTRPWGAAPAVLAAGLVALLPDMLAHGGVAYNDVPIALAFFVTIWGFDNAVRHPTVQKGILAGALLALALSIKFSAIVLVPVAMLLIVAEAATRELKRDWLRQLLPASAVGLVACYITLVLLYRGDFALSEFTYGMRFTFLHVSKGHGAPGYLLGQFSTTGWWYYFPVAFLFKTPAAFHLLGLLALLGLARTRPGWRSILRSRLRAPLFGLLVFAGALLTSSLNIGFRYALPALPLICVLVATGVVALWPAIRRELRVAVAVLVIWYGASSLSAFPHFLSYVSEYAPVRDRGDLVLLDSSLDWGQGLLELRDFMRSREIDRVFLSYFGSALPEGYGINYVTLPSFFALNAQGEWPDPVEAPRWVVISATNLHGAYVGRDLYARFRPLAPDTVLANSLFVYRLGT